MTQHPGTGTPGADRGGLRLLGVPVRIHGSFLIIVLLLGWSFGSDLPVVVTWVGVATVSVLWHELGHALAFRAFGHSPRIDLYGLGGATSSRGGPDLTAGRELLVSLAGPVAGLLLGVVALSVRGLVEAPGSRVATAGLDFLVWANIAWSVLNLLPILPLDGGRILRSVLAMATGGGGRAPALVVSAAVGAGGAGVAALAGWWWTAVLGGWFALANARGLYDLRVAAGRRAARERLRSGYAQLAGGDPAGALGVAREVAGSTDGDEELRAGVDELRAWAELLRGRPGEAAAVLEGVPRDHWGSGGLPEEVIRAAGGRERALGLLRDAYRAHPGPATGVRLAGALGAAGRGEEAAALLEEVRRAHGDGPGGPGGVGRPDSGTAADGAGAAGRAPAQPAGTTDAGAHRGAPGGGAADPRAADPGMPAPGAGGGPVPGVPPGTTACYRHPHSAAARACPECGRPVCGRCSIPTTAGVLCPPCVLELPQRGRRVVSLGVLVTLVAMGAVFLLQQTDASILGRFAAFPPAIAGGEWWRLLTPMLLHAGLAHIAFNGYALWLFGRQAELAFGTLRYAALFLVTGFAGNVAYYAFGACRGLAVGASGAVFGVLGALAWFLYRRRDHGPARSHLKGIAVLIAINLALGFAIPQIANLAHIGGLVAGGAVAAGLDRPGRPIPGGVQLLSVAGVVGASWWLAAQRTAGFLEACGQALFGG